MAVPVLGALLLAAAVLEVRVEGDRVSLRAERVPLGEVLDRLAERTGMKVEWAPNLGRPLVTARIEGGTPVEVVTQVLQGTTFNYALTSDDSRVHVRTLVIVGTSRSAAASDAPTPPRASEPLDAPSLEPLSPPPPRPRR